MAPRVGDKNKSVKMARWVGDKNEYYEQGDKHPSGDINIIPILLHEYLIWRCSRLIWTVVVLDIHSCAICGIAIISDIVIKALMKCNLKFSPSWAVCYCNTSLVLFCVLTYKCRSCSLDLWWWCIFCAIHCCYYRTQRTYITVIAFQNNTT